MQHAVYFVTGIIKSTAETFLFQKRLDFKSNFYSPNNYN